MSLCSVSQIARRSHSFLDLSWSGANATCQVDHISLLYIHMFGSSSTCGMFFATLKIVHTFCVHNIFSPKMRTQPSHKPWYYTHHTSATVYEHHIIKCATKFPRHFHESADFYQEEHRLHDAVAEQRWLRYKYVFASCAAAKCAFKASRIFMLRRQSYAIVLTT
jgi:hypothetical protein